jgi:hypothetical protein
MFTVLMDTSARRNMFQYAIELVLLPDSNQAADFWPVKSFNFSCLFKPESHGSGLKIGVPGRGAVTRR